MAATKKNQENGYQKISKEESKNSPPAEQANQTNFIRSPNSFKLLALMLTHRKTKAAND